MEQQNNDQPELEHTSLVTLQPIPEIVERQCDKWRKVMYQYGRDHAMVVIERDLKPLLENTRSKAYVKGFRAGCVNTKRGSEDERQAA